MQPLRSSLAYLTFKRHTVFALFLLHFPEHPPLNPILPSFLQSPTAEVCTEPQVHLRCGRGGERRSLDACREICREVWPKKGDLKESPLATPRGDRTSDWVRHDHRLLQKLVCHFSDKLLLIKQKFATSSLRSKSLDAKLSLRKLNKATVLLRVKLSRSHIQLQ